MELQQIIGFYHVVKEGSFTKAAEATFRTQSALSLQIKSLEKELDCQLIERVGRRKIKLTLAGEKLFQYAKSLFEQKNQLIADLNEIKARQIGRLRLAAAFYSLYYLTLDPIKRYTRQFPKVEIMVLDRPPHNVIQLVRQGDIDFGICMESIVPKDLITLPLVRVECLLMTPSGHPLTEKRNFKLHEIADYLLILPPKNLHFTAREKFKEKFDKEGMNYSIAMESSNIELTAIYVKMGLGIAFVCVAKDLPVLKQEGIEVIPLNKYFKPDKIAVIHRKNKALNFYEKAFLDCLFDSSSDFVESAPILRLRAK
ncbi:MAG: LysR family transcriptional regulator [Deltaproteobacteria bacterium]|nr:LysR family transcriptional regulator [Deltaproteobacteria bacterium]